MVKRARQKMDGVLSAIMRAAVFLLSRAVNIIRGPVIKRMRAIRMARRALVGAFGVSALAPESATEDFGCNSNLFMPTEYPRSRRLPSYFENPGSKTFNIFKLFWFLEGCGRFCAVF